MYDTTRQPSVDRYSRDTSVELRLAALLHANEMEDDRRLLFRSPAEEEELRLMRRAIPRRRAFAIFGLLLGGLPSAAIFIKIFGFVLAAPGSQLAWIVIPVVMNAVCCLAGARLASKLSGMVSGVEHDSWCMVLLKSVIIGLVWGAGTGAAGGFPAWGFGAIFGAICAIPVGILGFVLFVPLHRLLERGGMIDARHFWPIACGVVMVISAFILGLGSW